MREPHTEARLVEFFDQAAAGMAQTDPAGRFLRVNDRYCTITGRTREELLDLRMQDITHPGDLPGNLGLFEQAVANGSGFDIEKRYVRGDGSEIWVHNSVTPLRGADGAVSGMVCVTIDITEQREAEERLRKSQEIFYNLIHDNPFGVYVIDSDFRVAEVSLGSQKVFENVSPLVGRDFAEVLRIVWEEPFATEAIDRFRHTLATGEPYASPSTVARRGDLGVIEAYDWRINRIVLPDGRFGVVCYFYDLSSAEAARRQADALYRAYFENTPEALFVIRVEDGPAFFIEEINKAHEEGVGFKIDDIRDRRIEDALPPAVAERVIETYRQVFDSGTLLSYREVFDLGGDPQHWDTSLVPVRDPDGRISRIIGSSRNVTRQIVAEEALRQTQKMEAIGQLTGGVAHDFNNLLTPIIGGLDIIQRQLDGDERVQRILSGALASAERARVLVQRLLAFARRQPLQTSAVDIARLVRGMVELVASTTGPQVRVTVNVPDSLPPALADPNQVEMALLNLCVNARDAMPDGGTLTISAADETLGPGGNLEEGRYIRLSVSDTGIGMDPATAARAIEPFFSTKGVGKGTGLGLSMVHGLAAQLGGHLKLSSHPGMGTTVDLWLPAADEAGLELEREARAHALPGTGTALLVDDEELVRASTGEMLRQLGFEVTETESADAALQLVGAGLRPDLVVTDHLMVGRSGAELARELRLLLPGTPTLLISGYAEVEGIAPDLPRLAKPFRQEELAAAIARLVKPA